MYGSTLIQELYDSKSGTQNDKIYISVGNTYIDFEFNSFERRIVPDEELVLKSEMDEKVEDLESQIEKLQAQIGDLEGTIHDKNDEISNLQETLNGQ
jgi:chaperonin cofactor prefoldin